MWKFSRPAASMLAFILIGFLAGCASTSQPGGSNKPVRVNTATLPAAASAAAQGENALVTALLSAINAERAARGAGALGMDGALQRAAAIHSADMALRNFTGHHNPDGQGPAERVRALKPDFAGAVAENLAVLPDEAGAAPETLARKILKGWMTVPGQRRNLTEPQAGLAGIGTASGNGKLYVSALFTAP